MLRRDRWGRISPGAQLVMGAMTLLCEEEVGGGWGREGGREGREGERREGGLEGDKKAIKNLL
jgi:hypothetical protein